MHPLARHAWRDSGGQVKEPLNRHTRVVRLGPLLRDFVDEKTQRYRPVC